jgi:hypothetical protein
MWANRCDEPVSQLKLISVHIPKTGGASLGLQLRKVFEGRIQLVYDRVRAVAKFEPADDLPPGIDAVHGHIWPQNFDRVPRAYRMVFLRHPVDLAISRYFDQKSQYWPPWTSADRWLSVIRSTPPHPDNWGRTPPDILTFTRHSPSQTQLIDDYDMARFDFIGFHETRRADLARLNRLTGLQLDDSLYVNKTLHWQKERLALLADTRKIAQLTDTLRTQIAAYETLRARHC